MSPHKQELQQKRAKLQRDFMMMKLLTFIHQEDPLLTNGEYEAVKIELEQISKQYQGLFRFSIEADVAEVLYNVAYDLALVQAAEALLELIEKEEDAA